MYKVEISTKAAKALSKLPNKEQRLIGRAIDSLSKDPRPTGVEKLTDKDNLYRIKKGNYRIVYSIQDKKLIVLVVYIGDRKNIYRNI